MPVGHFPLFQILCCSHPHAISAAVPIAIASALRASALAKSENILNQPVITTDLFLSPIQSSNYRC